jgi:hypothetical protein
MKLKIFTIPLAWLFIIGCSGNHSHGDTNHYGIKLKLDPASQYLQVSANLRLYPKEPFPDTLNFSLHKQFDLMKVSGDAVHDFKFDKTAPPVSVFMREAVPLAVILAKTGDRNRPIDIYFEYEGKLTEWPQNSANIVTEDWVELGMYLPWFPSGFIAGHFTFEIEAECDAAYQLRSYNGYTVKNGTWYLKGTIPIFDIVLVASKHLKTVEKNSEKRKVFLHYQTLQDSTAEQLTQDLSGVLDFYSEWFGGVKQEENLTIIQSPRQRGGDYARRGLITLSRLTDERYENRHDEIIRNLAHEAAHFWWHLAPVNSWEDWLNEGFAEYSALLVLKEMFDEETFFKWMEEKKVAIKDTPPIWGFDRNNMNASGGPDIIQANLYSKGPVLLHLLSERIGYDEFKGLCMEMVETATASTDNFLALLENKHGEEVRIWFEDLLKSY